MQIIEEFLPQTVFFNLYVFAARCCRPLKLQTMKTVKLNSLKLNIPEVFTIRLRR